MNTVAGKYKTEFEGIINNLERRFRETQSNWIKEEIESYMSAYSMRRMPWQTFVSRKPGCYSRRYEYQRIL